MIIDILPVTQSELEQMTVVQSKLIRTAQQKKNELYHKLERDINAYKYICMGNGTYKSTIYEDTVAALEAECEYQTEIIREQLVFSMNLREPTSEDETGGNDVGGDETGYLLDYSLSYVERYIAVRDYYMTIADPNERLLLYTNDAVAQQYLGSYYTSLYNYFYSLT